MRYSIGVSIQKDRIDCALFNEDKQLVSREILAADSSLSPVEFFEIIVRSIQGFMGDLVITNDNIIGIGLSLPAIIRKREGTILVGFGFPRLNDFCVNEFIRQKLGDVLVVCDASVNAQALAEHRFGAGRNHSDMIYCTLDNNIAATAIMNNKLHMGASAVSGIYGHLIIDPNNALECECGNAGCVSSWAGGEMIVKHVRQWIQNGETTGISEIAGRAEQIAPAHINTAYERGDLLAQRAVNQISKHVGIWIFNLSSALDIDYVVLDGSFLNMGKKLIGPIRKCFDSYNHNRNNISFASSLIKKDLGIIGATELLFDNQRHFN